MKVQLKPGDLDGLCVVIGAVRARGESHDVFERHAFYVVFYTGEIERFPAYTRPEFKSSDDH